AVPPTVAGLDSMHYRTWGRWMAMSSNVTLRGLLGLGDAPAALQDSALIMIDCQNTYRRGVMQLEGAEDAFAEAARMLARARARRPTADRHPGRNRRPVRRGGRHARRRPRLTGWLMAREQAASRLRYRWRPRGLPADPVSRSCRCRCCVVPAHRRASPRCWWPSPPTS